MCLKQFVFICVYVSSLFTPMCVHYCPYAPSCLYLAVLCIGGLRVRYLPMCIYIYIYIYMDIYT